jgi:hypothetical protein
MTAMLDTAQRRRLITGGDPDRHYPVPADGDFVPQAWLDEYDWRTRDDDNAPHDDYLPAPEIARIAAKLIAGCPDDFKHLADMAIDYRWKRRGGTRAGKATLGTCEKLSAEIRVYTEHRFLICLGADHLRDMRATYFQIEALVYHELLHAETDEDGQPTLAPHDFEGFAREIQRYGLWQHDYVVAARAFAAVQLPLFRGVS